MKHYNYLIIGGGMTGDAAVKGIRELDENGSIGMVSSEKEPPYSRPPLTKGLWKDTPEEKIWKNTETKNINLFLNSTAVSIDTSNKTVLLDTGDKLGYDKLLLATGGKPNKLPSGGDNIIYYRAYDDYKRLKEIADRKNNFTIIGGGFIGSEIAAALAMNGKKVTMIFPEKNIGEKVFPSELAEFVTDYYRDKGVELANKDSIKSIEGKSIITGKGITINSDAIIAGIGIKPDTKLAESANIQIDNGIVVDEFLRTNQKDIYAAGDNANFFNPALNKRIRVEHEDNANTMGKQAGRVMAGEEKPFEHLPFFYSDMFELGYEAVGELDSRMETFSDWKVKFKEGVIYYLKGGRVKGVLLWNVWGQVDEARKLINEKVNNKEKLKGRLPKK